MPGAAAFTVSPLTTAATFTPGDINNDPYQGGGNLTPASAALGQMPAMAPHSVPVWGILVVVAVLLLLEHRRLKFRR